MYRGGCADVWKGKYRDLQVAVKVLRVYSTSDFEKIKSVRFKILSKGTICPLILAITEVLQRSRCLEDSSTSKRFTTPWSDNNQFSLGDDIGVDDKRKYQRVS